MCEGHCFSIDLQHILLQTSISVCFSQSGKTNEHSWINLHSSVIHTNGVSHTQTGFVCVLSPSYELCPAVLSPLWSWTACLSVRLTPEPHPGCRLSWPYYTPSHHERTRSNGAAGGSDPHTDAPVASANQIYNTNYATKKLLFTYYFTINIHIK